MTSDTKYISLIPNAAAAVLFCAYLSVNDLPERNIYPVKEGGNIMSIIGTATATEMPFEVSNYKFLGESKVITEQIDIIHNVLSILIEKSQDLDPQYSKIVDKYFWDLV